jgi:kumamolisin
MLTRRFALPGSGRSPLKDAHIVGAPDPAAIIEVTAFLRRRQPFDDAAMPRRLFSHDQFARLHGASDKSLEAVEAFARHYDLTVASADLARRSAVLAGAIGSMNEAFGTTLKLCQTERGAFRCRHGELFLPISLQHAVSGVFGLDNRPQAFSHCRRQHHSSEPSGDSRAARSMSYTPMEVARAYRFPSGTGRGQTLAIIELGGGYRISDLHAYFRELGVPAPAITAVSVGGARNAPTGDPAGPDGEVLLDIEIAGAIASGARLVVYFAPNTDKGFFDAIATAVHDSVRTPSVVSISWGAPESTWTKQALHAYDELFQDAAALGITVCVAAGDNGSNDGLPDGRAHVDFPASSPHVLACGGTRLEVAGRRIAREVVWNDEEGGGATGGGVSETFARPSYQANANVPSSPNASHFTGRGVPDVAGNADPETGYRIRVDGHDTVVGGTSAVAPLWAALIALRNEMAGTPLGYANPLFYGDLATKGFRDIKNGGNGAYRAVSGWDPCTGLGSPAGPAFAKMMALATGGRPRSSSLRPRSRPGSTQSRRRSRLFRRRRSRSGSTNG